MKWGFGDGKKETPDTHELQLAKRVGGRRQPGSGAFSGHKGDVKSKDFLFEHKETVAFQYILKARELAKIQKEADGEGKDPAFVFRFNNPIETEQSWVAVPLSIFEELIG